VIFTLDLYTTLVAAGGETGSGRIGIGNDRTMAKLSWPTRHPNFAGGSGSSQMIRRNAGSPPNISSKLTVKAEGNNPPPRR
jgi:hypothetical protein